MRLTKNHIEIMAALDRLGQSYSYEIARETGQDRPAVARRLDKLALRGLIEAVDAPEDWVRENARQKGIVRFWRLTDKGRECLEDN